MLYCDAELVTDSYCVVLCFYVSLLFFENWRFPLYFFIYVFVLVFQLATCW